MGFAAFAPLIGAGISAAGSAAGGKGGGGSSGTQNQAIDLRNFLDFQEPALTSLFGSLTPDLLTPPSTATAATNEALSGARGLLGRLQGLDPLGDLQGVRDIANQDISAQPFNEAQDRFEEIFDNAERLFGAELGRDFAERAVGLLTPTAEGRFLPGQDQANRFFEPGVVDPALDDARNQVATLFTNQGRLNSPSAAQTVARETGRIAGGLRSNQFQFERGLQQNAQAGIGQLDAGEGVRRLNAITGQNNAQLGATQGIQNSIAAAEQRRQGLLGLRAGISGQQLGLQQSLINSLPQLAAQQTDLPFRSRGNFANIASLPLGKQGTVLNANAAAPGDPGFLQSLAGGALVGKGLFGDPGGSILSGDITGGGGKGGGVTENAPLDLVGSNFSSAGNTFSGIF